MKQNRLQIAPMAPEHVPDIARLEAVCFSQPWSEEGIAEELQNPTACFVTALVDEEVAGYAGMHGVCGEGYIANVAVFPKMRGKGVGRALIQALVSRAQAERYEFLSLEVRPSNLAALGLYQSEGFQQVGVRKGFYDAPKEDGLILTRFFSPWDKAIVDNS